MSEYKDKDRSSKQSGQKVDAPVNLGRHRAQCTICRHSQREEIEEKWIEWGCTATIAKEFGVSRDSIYRHSRALNLFSKRQANFKTICEKVLERGDLTLFTGSNFVSMFNAYVKIILAEKNAEAAPISDAKALQADRTQEMEDCGSDGVLANAEKNAEAARTSDVETLPPESTEEVEDNGSNLLLANLITAAASIPEEAQVDTQEHQRAEDTSIQ